MIAIESYQTRMHKNSKGSRRLRRRKRRQLVASGDMKTTNHNPIRK